jgi:Phage integrase family/Phage integrase, N-terminal SAM-like domain
VARSRRQWGSVRSLASGRYQARYLDPDTRRMTPAPQTFATKTRADRWLATKRTELDAGTAVDDKAGHQPLRDWWPGYWRATQSRSPHTRIGYETAWRLRIEPRFGSMPVRQIKSFHVDDWVADMVEQGLSVSKITESLGVLKRVLDRVMRDRVIAINPCSLRAVTLPKRSQMERPVLSPAEVEKLAQAMDHESDRVLVLVLAFGGLRINECFALQWSDVDLERKTLAVRCRRQWAFDRRPHQDVRNANDHAARCPSGAATHSQKLAVAHKSCLPQPRRQLPPLQQLAT